jgi:hypothetical protein
MTAARHRSADPGASFAAHAKRKLWRSRIHVNGRDHHLGYYASPEEARRAHAAAAEQFGLKLKGNLRARAPIAAKLEDRPV